LVQLSRVEAVEVQAVEDVQHSLVVVVAAKEEKKRMRTLLAFNHLSGGRAGCLAGVFGEKERKVFSLKEKLREGEEEGEEGGLARFSVLAEG